MISLTSLIDVVFLLLVFFMLSSTFLKFGTVTIETAGASNGGAPVDLSKIVLVHVGANRTLRVNGAETQPPTLNGVLDGLIEAGATDAVIQSTPDATVDDLIAGVTQVRRSSFRSVRIVH